MQSPITACPEPDYQFGAIQKQMSFCFVIVMHQHLIPQQKPVIPSSNEEAAFLYIYLKRQPLCSVIESDALFLQFLSWCAFFLLSLHEVWLSLHNLFLSFILLLSESCSPSIPHCVLIGCWLVSCSQ